MTAEKNIIIPGANKLPIAIDIFFEDEQGQKPVIVYAHGFNGFKDWGNFDLIAEKFSKAGFVLVKFNFSHNGTTPETPEEFTNLEAFGNNNYTKQLADFELVINWVCDPGNRYHSVMDTNNICLMGHSMGGGIAILHASEDKRIKKLITWASIIECKTPWGTWPAEKMQQWKETGVAYYINSRTNQQMPMYYQLYEDYIKNMERLDIQKAIGQLDIPILICHGTADNAVPVENAHTLKSWQPLAQLLINDSDHVFGRKHPWTTNELPVAMEKVMEVCLDFLHR
jgi:alpha-beta hydrolase superfamily lysophospholipase